MENSKLVECFRQLCFENVKDIDSADLESKITDVYEKLQINYEDSLSDVTSMNFSKDINPEWRYICLGFYIIKSLFQESEKSDTIFLSVQETKDFKQFLRSIINIGICSKLQPNLPFSYTTTNSDNKDIFWNYNMLKCTTFGLTEFLKIPLLRLSIIPEGLKEILVALYQISYCPLKKPNPDGNCGEILMTKEIYEKLLQEQQLFLKTLDHLRQTLHPHIFVKNTMAILYKNSPTWFKKQVSKTLTDILRSENGVELVAVALFADQQIDSTHIWKTLDVFAKLILSCKKFPDFKENICKQIIRLLDKQQEKSVAENIFTYCVKTLYKEDSQLCKTIFIREIINPFLYFTYKTHKFDEENVTEKIKLNCRLLHAVFTENANEENVPIDILKPIINVIFRFYVLTMESSLKALNNDLKDILILYLEDQLLKNYILIFDTLLFKIVSEEILPFRTDLVIEVDSENIMLKKSQLSVRYSSSENCERMLEILRPKPKLLTGLFRFLLNCIVNESKYFQRAKEDLLELENELMTEFLERKIIVYKLLAEVANESSVQKQMNENPTDIVEYINKVFKKSISLGTHLLDDSDSEGFHSVFTLLMILENLLTNSSKVNQMYYNILIEPLKSILEKSSNKELKDIIKKNLNILDGTAVKETKPKTEVLKTELDKAVYDICDPLLPTRGHGLLTLTKLLEKKDKVTMERKHFVLNLLQQNLTNDDSFIYLSAINGLVAMADIFPDTIIKILCDEYSDSSKKGDLSEVRMKLGEVLVKVLKTLGDMAPKHKPLLLNTFLVGAKDDDDLIRSSSLSNLGEICRVLGYKLGSMFTEILACVHSIISTDKSPQARRAAVTVIRQLFIGLDQEIIAYFKDDILPLYRTLKQIYNNDSDDIMKLQAQLALEELNESMKHFVFPKPQLSSEKKIVMLD